MILPSADGMESYERLLQEIDPPKIDEKTYGPEHGIVREVTWELAPGVLLQYMEDGRSDARAVIVASTDEVRADKYADLLERYLTPLDLEVLVAEAGSALEKPARIQALIRAGFGAPHEYDERFFELIRKAMNDADADVRKAGILATTYSFWDEYREQFRRMANDDPDEEIREQARILAAAPFDQYGRPREDEQ